MLNLTIVSKMVECIKSNGLAQGGKNMQQVFTSSPKFFKLTAFVILILMMMGTAILYFANYKWVTVYVDGKTYQCVTLAKGVEEVLEEIGLGLRAEDYVVPPKSEKLKRWTAIAVVKAQPFTINHDGSSTEVWSVGAKVADVLLDAGLQWQEPDQIIPPLESAAAGNREIALVRVSSELTHKMVTLPYSVLKVANDSLYRGQERLVQSGQDGQQVQVIQTVYHDNQAVERNVISNELLVAARDKILEYGTIASINRGGLKIGISRVLDVQSTAYCSGVEGSGCPVDERGYSKCTGKATGYTATGRKAIQGAGTRTDPYIIAVDRNLIPLGTLCYLSFQGGFVTTRHGRIIKDGFALAADTGSAIKGNRIDILFDNHWVAWYYGRRGVRVFIVESVNAE
jgi:uncharacterized protein YabE (DUF348 family)